MRIRNNLMGNKFNRLTVMEPVKRKVGERTKYKCICDCGNEIVVEGSKLKNGHTKSCGCKRKEVDYGSHNRLPEGIASRNNLIATYKSNAKNKNINFELTDEEMIFIFESDCYYCGREPYMVTHKKNLNGGYIYTGIDRLKNDKSIGYILNNIVPCCSKCNYIKNKMDRGEFLEWVQEVYLNLLKNNQINPKEQNM